jgi:DNA-binding beta-propeller fold protein YncE
MDYLAVDREGHRVVVPASDLGAIFFLDSRSLAVTRVDGAATATKVVRGESRKVGPSSAAVGDGAIFFGSRADDSVFALDPATSKIGGCVKLASTPDGVAYLPSRHELWVTTPRASSLVVIDASKPASLKVVATIKVVGEPEGYAFDATHGWFLTNLEDADKTLVIDVASRTVRATYAPGCGSAGPRGIAVDSARSLAIVACTDHLQVLDLAHDGAQRGRLDTGAGVDNIELDARSGRVFVAAGKDGALTVAALTDTGALERVAKGTLSAGARTVVVDAEGCAVAIDPKAGGLLRACPDAR